MIELAAKTWKLSVPAAIVKLRRNGFDLPLDRCAIQRYQQEHIEYRVRLIQLWRESQHDRIVQDPIVQGLAGQFGLRADISDARWRDGPAELFGVLDRATIERYFAPGAMAHADA